MSAADRPYIPDLDRIAPGLLHPEDRGVPVASKQLALRDLKATGRNLHLVDEQLMEDESIR